MITLYQFEVSPFCDKVRRACRYKHVPFQVEEVSLLGAGKFSSARKLPVIDDGGIRIEDSTQILFHLENKYPEPPLLPEDGAQRALCNIIEDWADESLYYYDIALHFSFPENARRRADHLLKHEKPLMKKLLGPFVPSLLRKAAQAQGAGRRPRSVILADIERHIASLDRLLAERDFLVCDALTTADISVFVELDAIKVAELGQEILARFGAIEAWMARVDELTGP